MLDRNAMEVLSADECRRLLEQAAIGRVGVIAQSRPLVLPVNFALLDGDIVFRSTPGSKLVAAAAGQVVCFEIDGVDTAERSGWSVVINGRASLIDSEEMLARAQSLPLEPWLSLGAAAYVRVTVDLLSGRRIVAGR